LKFITDAIDLNKPSNKEATTKNASSSSFLETSATDSSSMAGG
jgi:hypothetical protein